MSTLPPAEPDPGPFSNAPDRLSLSGNEAAFVVPNAQPSELGTGGGADGADNNGAADQNGAGAGNGATSGNTGAGSGTNSGNAATGSGSQTGPGLARTGTATPVLATISVLFLSIGGVLMVASRRELEDD